METRHHDDDLATGRLRVSLLTTALALLAIPALVWTSQRHGEIDIPIMLVVGLLFVAGEVFTIDVEFRHESQNLTFSSVPLIVGLMVLPPALVVAIRLVSMLTIFACVQRQPPFKLAFNSVVTVLDTTIVAAFIAAGPDGEFGPRHWVVVFVAVVVGDAFGALATTAAISAFQGRWEPGTLGDLVLTTIGAVADVGIAVVAVTLIEDKEPAAVILLGLGVFVIGVSRAYARVRTRYRALEVLDQFTRAVGESVIDGSVVVRLLTESAEILHAERAWLIAIGPDRQERLGVRDGVLEVAPLDELDRALAREHRAAAQLHASDGPLAEELTGAGVGELIVAPLSATGDTRFTLVIADRSGEVREFDDDDVALFDTLAVHAGLALQNLGLVQRLRDEIAVTEHTATHDALTGLPNRSLFQQRLDHEISGGTSVAVLLLDVDRFKEVNDTLGHRNGDTLLVDVGRRLAAALPDADVARLGGDEFAVLLRDATVAEAVETGRHVLAELGKPFLVADVAIDVAASIGVAVHHGDTLADGVTLLRQADVAMYLAKEDRSGVEVYSADRDHYSPHRLALVGRLRTAIEERNLVLHYQPQLDLATGDVIGVEALIRWPQPGRTPIPPDEFIYIAEHTGLIHPLTQFVLEDGIAQAARWHREGIALRVSLNLSAHDLVDERLTGRIADLLARHELPARWLMIELTESAVMSNPTRSVEIMQSLRSIGVSIAIDDFGTGHSSLAYLTGLPATELKIDKSFVFAMGSDPAADTIVRAIVDLARNLGLGLVAEGVETEAHAAALSAMGCDVVQGYFYSRPLEVRGLELWLEGQRIAPEESPASVTRP